MFRSAILFVALAFATPAAVAGTAAEAVVETTAERLSAGEFDGEALLETLDTKRIARFALGKHARKFDAKDVDRFTAAFERFLEQRFDEEAERFDGAKIRVVGSTDRNDRDSIVITDVELPDDDPMTVRWRLIADRGEWRVVDMEVAGLWLAIEQRAQISAVLGRSGSTVADAVAALGVEEDRS